MSATVVKRRSLLLGATSVAALATMGVRAEEPLGIKRLRFVFELTNQGTERLERPSFTLYGPISTAACHELLETRASRPSTTTVDADGNRKIDFNLDPFPPLATSTLRVDFSLAVRERGTGLPSESARRSAPLVESENPVVVSLARSLQQANEQGTVRAIFDWLVRHVEYAGYVAEDRGALYAIQERRGDCTEFAYATAALCRAVGISARVLGGYVVTGPWRQPQPAEYHNWAEAFVQGRWVLVDAQRQVLDREVSDYVPLRVVNPPQAPGAKFVHRFQAPPEVAVTQI